jgi:hypothetical protein
MASVRDRRPADGVSADGSEGNRSDESSDVLADAQTMNLDIDATSELVEQPLQPFAAAPKADAAKAVIGR